MALRAMIRKEKGNSGARLFAIFVGVVMLASVAAYVFSINPNSQAGTFRYAGMKFTQNAQGVYITEINGQQTQFLFRPEDLADVDLPEGIVQKLTGTASLQTTYYWNSSLAQNIALFQLDASNVLESTHNVFMQSGFTTPNPLGGEVINCDNATNFIPVLLMQYANNTAIGTDPSNSNCIVMNASYDVGFVRISERLIYAMLAGENEH